jgi:hypothetical protein
VSSRAQRLGRWLRGAGADIAGTVYGEIIVLSVIAAGAEQDAASLAGLVASTIVVFWLAHVYAQALGHSVREGRRLTAGDVRTVARRESAMLQAGMLPTFVLLLGAFGVISDGAAIWAAMAVGVATLAGQALVYARLERLAPLATLSIVGVNLAFGLVIVALKAFVSH